jgi:hypothetical protein
MGVPHQGAGPSGCQSRTVSGQGPRPAALRELYAALRVKNAPHRLRFLPGSLMPASRNLLVALVVLLVVGLAVTGYALYQEKKQPEGVEISVGKNGLSIKEK